MFNILKMQIPEDFLIILYLMPHIQNISQDQENSGERNINDRCRLIASKISAKSYKSELIHQPGRDQSSRHQADALRQCS